MSSAGFEIGIPLSTIRWISQTGAQAVEHNALTIYREINGEWRLYLFGTEDLPAFVEALRQVTNISFSTDAHHGPAKALRARQNLLGQWERDHTVTLYLAPDRLLADWRSAVPLDAIRELAVIADSGVTSGSADLLRIIYTDPEGKRQIVGFEINLAWAWELSRRTGIAIDHASGRKKK
jgi:hypothetical protein